MTSQLMNGANHFKLLGKVNCLEESQNVTTACTKGSTEEVLNVVYTSEENMFCKV